MKARVIVSTTERKINPWISFIMSLSVPGFGELYAGKPHSGIIFSLSRLAAVFVIPFYSFVNSSETMTEEIFTAFVLFILITIISGLHAFFISRRRKSLLSWYNSAVLYSIFISTNILLTAAGAAIFISFFEIKKTDEAQPPLIRKGDFIIIKKIIPSGYNSGDIVAVKTGSDEKLLRVIGLPGEKISYVKGRFLSDGSELPLSIFTEEELRELPLTDYDVISEQNGKVRYAVKGDPDHNIPEIALKDKEYFLAPDIRDVPELFLKAESAQIKGRVEGILFSPADGILPGETSLPSDNSISPRHMK